MYCKYFVQNINDTEYSNALASWNFCSERSVYTKKDATIEFLMQSYECMQNVSF